MVSEGFREIGGSTSHDESRTSRLASLVILGHHPSASNVMSEFPSRSGVVPAQLSFLAIYNPSLGSNDESLHDQVVFYSSKASRARSGRKTNTAVNEQGQHEEENEKLRQIGLAQGMVEFAKYATEVQLYIGLY